MKLKKLYREGDTLYHFSAGIKVYTVEEGLGVRVRLKEYFPLTYLADKFYPT